MANQIFYDSIFPEFWEKLDHSNITEDKDSMFGGRAPETFDWVIKMVQPRQIIEVGSWKGHSANHIIDQCRVNGIEAQIVCVDTFLGGPEHWLIPGAIEKLGRKNGQPTILNNFLGNVLARSNAGRVFPLCLDSGSASQVLAHFSFKADLIYIDGGHGYDVVCHDIMNYHRLLSAEGVMFGDDYQHEPLANAVHDCARKLGVHVLVHLRKWIFLTEALMRKIALPDIQLRTEFAGWVHPK